MELVTHQGGDDWKSSSRDDWDDDTMRGGAMGKQRDRTRYLSSSCGTGGREEMDGELSWVHAARSHARASEMEGKGLPGRGEKDMGWWAEVEAGVGRESSEMTEVLAVLPGERAREIAARWLWRLRIGRGGVVVEKSGFDMVREGGTGREGRTRFGAR